MRSEAKAGGFGEPAASGKGILKTVLSGKSLFRRASGRMGSESVFFNFAPGGVAVKDTLVFVILHLTFKCMLYLGDRAFVKNGITIVLGGILRGHRRHCNRVVIVESRKIGIFFVKKRFNFRLDIPDFR